MESATARGMLILTTNTGKTTEAQGACHLKLKFCDEIFDHLVVVASIKEEIILGLDFMKANGTKLELEAGIIYSKDQKLPLLNSTCTQVRKDMDVLLVLGYEVKQR